MNIRAHISRLLVEHPFGWGLVGLLFFWIWGGLIPKIEWNIMEMMIGRNLILGNGLVAAPYEPPALWRPPLGSGLCAFVELFTSDPFLIFRIIYTASLTIFLVCMFYSARGLWGMTAAHVACMFVLTSGALTARLISHNHSISHVAFLLVAGPAFLCTIMTMRKPTGFRLFSMGACWGLAFLTRWETLPFFVLTLGILAWGIWAASRSLRRFGKCVLAVLGFGLCFVPNVIYQKHVRNRYGISGPSAISTFYASEAWVSGRGDEDEGFQRAVRIYGSMEANGFSMFRAIARNPGAVFERLQVNVPIFLGLFAEREFFDPLWLILLAGLAIVRGWFERHRLAVIWLCLLFLSSATVCLFQIDSRYLIISLPGLLLLLCGGAQGFVQQMNAWTMRRKTGILVACLFVFGLRMGYASIRQMTAAERAPTRLAGSAAIAVARELAGFFHETIRTARPAVLTLDAKADAARVPVIDELLLSYFAGTGISWRQSGTYPRDMIFSWKPKRSDYLIVPEDSLDATDLLLSGGPIASRMVADGTVYHLFRAPEGKLNAPVGAASDLLLAILERDYPALAPRLLEKVMAGRLRPVLSYMGKRAHLGIAGSNGMSDAPAGHRDLLFKLTLHSDGAITQAVDLGIGYIELRRKNAIRTFSTNGKGALLRVALEESGVPLNGADGGVKIPLSDSMEIWLRVCDDGGNAPDVSYRCRVRIGGQGWIVSEAVPSH